MRPEVNVTVGGPKKPTNYTYKTVVLKSNLGFEEQTREPWCIYVIKWDFDLKGRSVEIPANCVLEFKGGSLSNGTLVCNDTTFVSHTNRSKILHNVELDGDYIFDNTEDGDKPYNPDVASGLGRVFLRKNMVNGSNILTKEMVSDANTIYVIQYDYTLAENITIPANCILQFDGGTISGVYTLTGSGTSIHAGLIKIFNTNVTLAGTWNIAEAYPEWFGAKGDGTTDDASAFNKAKTISDRLILLEKTYKVSSFSASSMLSIIGNNSIIKLGSELDVSNNMGCRFENITFKTDETLNYLIHVNSNVYHSCFYRCIFIGTNISNAVLYFDGSNNAYYGIVDNCRIVNAANIGILFYRTANACIVSNNEFYNCSICIKIDGCDGTRISGNTFQNYISKGILFDWTDGSITTQNIVIGNYFEGSHGTLCGIDFNNNNDCCGNYIIGNYYTHGGADYSFIIGQAAKNTIIGSAVPSLGIANFIEGFLQLSTYNRSSISSYSGHDGAIVNGKSYDDQDRETNYLYRYGKINNSEGWRKILQSESPASDVLTLDTLTATNIIQHYNGYIQIGRDGAAGARRITYYDNYDNLCYYNSDSERKDIQTLNVVKVGEDRPIVLPGYCTIDMNLDPARPIWKIGTGWIDATGEPV